MEDYRPISTAVLPVTLETSPRVRALYLVDLVSDLRLDAGLGNLAGSGNLE